MKQKLSILLFTCLAAMGFAQEKQEWGSSFEFDTKNELDAQIVLEDNYNTYLYSVVNTDGMMAQRKVIIRKMDQKNQLVDTYTADFPKFDIATLYNYLGIVKEQGGKVAAFVYAYSGKAKKGEVYKIEFDKAKAAFSTTSVYAHTIESAMKSGDVWMEKSHSGNYAAVVVKKHRAKNQPEINNVIVLDGAALNKVWEKELSFANEHITKYVTVTNSGKVVLLRDFSSFKKDKNYNYLVEVTADGETEKNFEEKIYLQQPIAVSIGSQDYLIAFNATSRGFRANDYSYIMLYDLQNSRILGNNKISDYANQKDLEEVLVRGVYIQNNEFHIFTEAKNKVPVKPSQGFSSGFPVDQFTFGPSVLYVVSFEGALKTNKKITDAGTKEGSLYHAYGIANVKGTYYINLGYGSGLYRMDNTGSYDKAKSPAINFYLYDPQRDRRSVIAANQIMAYLPDNNKMIFAMVTGENQLTIVSVPDLKF